MTTTNATAPPRGLGPAGRALWRDVARKYELRVDEQVVLGEVCRILDIARRLEREMVGAPVLVVGSAGQDRVNPLLVELRGQRESLARMLRQLDLPDVDGTGQRVPSAQHQAAARTRWDAVRAARAQREGQP